MLIIKENVKLAPYTSFKIGGEARYFTEVKNENELQEALQYALKNKLDFFVLGGGSNVLVSDYGFNGLIIKISSENIGIKIKKCYVKYFTGNNLSEAVNFARDNSLVGLEWAAGIPGTIGGAVRGNAGAFGGDMKSVINKVECFCIDGKLEKKSFSAKDCKFEYRNSLFKQSHNLIIASVILKLKEGKKEEIQNKMKEIILQRKEKNPKEAKNAGSFFVNPIVNKEWLLKEFEKDSGKKASNNVIPAGWLIQEAGMIGKKIGGAAVSEKHSNFIVNVDNATAEDVIMLASIIKQKVRTKFGVQLVEEVKFLGF